ncbi:hypothetical protein SSX86_006668 [Deinandra increscens subsp. villosa]|uniref:Protein kinase domain-containing protein n=1 Tax=Deinandra increscens subsp. villosa TaxID=3103831 RepID=A0AAP0H6Q9_9ASTR
MNSTTEEGGKSASSSSAHPCRLFSLAEIKSATNNFDDELVIGEGGFGKVYKGQISSEQDGHVNVAIKRLDSMSSQGEAEFRAEIDMLSTLRHCHLVSLIGYCHEKKEMILVYEYMPNGTLYHHLHKAETPLSWLTRLKIAVGAARGLDYLHTGVGTLHGVIHRDIKSSNILLDENWASMISDFGLSKIGPTNQPISYIDASVKGTFGYLDPEFFYTTKLTRKTDVYAFGVVLFELLSGRLPVDEQYGEEDCSLVRWAQKCVKGKKFDQMVDPNIKGTVFPNHSKRFAQIANRCVGSILKERPTMTEIVASLQALLELHDTSNHSGKSSGIMSFNWKLAKYFGSMSKPNSASQNHIVRYPPMSEVTTSEGNTSEGTMSEELKNQGNFEYLLDSGIIGRLPLVTKVKILIGIARKIALLQKPEFNQTWPGAMHSELDRSKILLDKDFTPTLSCNDEGPYDLADPDTDGLVLACDLSGYKVIFVEVLTRYPICHSYSIDKINRLCSQCGKESLDHFATLCFKICNEVDSESKMLAILKDHDELILKSLDDPRN